MASYTRIVELRSRLADILCDFFEDQFHRGEITKEEMNFYYVWAGNSIGLEDLLPSSLSEVEVKDERELQINRLMGLIKQRAGADMSYKAFGVSKIKGFEPDADLLKSVTEKAQSGFGYAVCLDGKIYRDVQPDGISQEGIEKVCKDWKELPMIFHTVQSTNAVLKEDIQPFVLASDEAGDPLLVCLIEGPGLDESYQQNSPYSSAFHFCEKRLRPKINKLMKSTGTFEGAMEEINASDEIYLNELADMLPHDSSLVLLAADNANPFTLNKPAEREAAFDWGSVLGTTIYPSSDVKRPEKEMSVIDKARAAMALGKTAKEAVDSVKGKPTGPVIQPKVVEKKDNVIELAKQKESDKDIVVPDNAVLTAPPKEVDDKPALYEYYVKGLVAGKPAGIVPLGYMPSNWKNRPSVIVGTIVAPQKVSPKQEKLKDTTAHHLAPGVHRVPSDPMPVLAASTIQEISKDFLPKILGHNSEFVEDPAKQAADFKLPSLANQFGKVSVKDFMYGPRGRYQICAEYPEFAQMLIRDWMSYALSLEKSKVALEEQNRTLGANIIELRNKLSQVTGPAFETVVGDKVITEPKKEEVAPAPVRQAVGVRRRA